jgi:hypothetical protein
MIKEFLRNVDEVQLDLRLGKQFHKYRPSEPLASNEKKVGTITDSWRKALCIAFRMHCVAIDELMSAPGAQMDAEQRNRLADEKSTLAALVFGELRSIFGNSVIGVRRNWAVVAMAEKPKPARKTKRKPDLGKMVRPKDYLPGNIAHCGNRACKTCYPEKEIPLPPRPQGEHMIK